MSTASCGMIWTVSYLLCSFVCRLCRPNSQSHIFGRFCFNGMKIHFSRSYATIRLNGVSFSVLRSVPDTFARMRFKQMVLTVLGMLELGVIKKKEMRETASMKNNDDRLLLLFKCGKRFSSSTLVAKVNRLFGLLNNFFFFFFILCRTIHFALCVSVCLYYRWHDIRMKM